jgi:heptosyltransferase-3
MFQNKQNLNRKNYRNILLIQLGDIGDVVLSLPSIRALKENFQQANVVVAVREKAQELIQDCPWATGVIAIDKNSRSFIQEIICQKNFFLRIRKYHFDLVLDLRTGTRGAILAMLSGARQRVGFYASDGKVWRNRLFTHLYAPETKPGDYVADRYLSLLVAHNITTDNCEPEIDVPLEKQQNADAIFTKAQIPFDRPVIAIQPFALWQYKEWGLDKYIQLINRLVSEYNVSVIITGSPDESKQADEIIKQCRRNTYNLAGRTSLGTLSAVLKTCSLFIGGDSAGIHIAAAVGTPTVSIFGPSSSADWAPRGKQHTVVQKDLECAPCHKKGCQGKGFSRCLEELTVDEVMTAVRSQMSKMNRVGI